MIPGPQTCALEFALYAAKLNNIVQCISKVCPGGEFSNPEAPGETETFVLYNSICRFEQLRGSVQL